MDKDLQSVAQVRELLKKAEDAQCQLAEKSQQELDNIIKSIGIIINTPPPTPTGIPIKIP